MFQLIYGDKTGAETINNMGGIQNLVSMNVQNITSLIQNTTSVKKTGAGTINDYIMGRSQHSWKSFALLPPCQTNTNTSENTNSYKYKTQNNGDREMK